MSSYTGLSPKGPAQYVGPNVYIQTVVTRHRSPTSADYRQPETGKLYPTGSFWLTGSDPTTGVEGDIWMLSKIVGNVAFWVMMGSGGSSALFFADVQAATAPGVDPVQPTGGGIMTINGAVVANHGVPLESHTRALNAYNMEVQYAGSAAATDGTLSGVCHFNTAEFTVDASGFVSLAGGGLAIDSIAVQTGTSPVVPTAAGLVTINGAVVAAGTNPVRTNGTGANTLALEVQISQAIAATDATKIGLSNFNSAHFTVDANGFVSLSGAGQAIDSIGVDAISGGGTNPVLPDAAGLVTNNGAVVAAGTNPIRTVSTAVNVYQTQVQISQAIAATDATKIGLCNFDSAAFDVDANGFVQLNGGGIAATSFDVQASTAPGTDPVVPTAAGIVTVNGAAVANHSVVLETRSRAANAYNIEVQYATSAAATDATKSGVAHFDSGNFSVDANGFVSLLGGAGFVWTDVSGAFSPLKNNGYFITGTATGTLPASPAQGDTIQFFVDHASQVLTIDAPGTQIIRMGTLVTSAGGTATSTQQGDSIELVYRSANTCWEAVDWVGTWPLT